ncbi:MAG: isochorismatase family protein [Betaproteobacteria bacterium]
MHPSSLPADIVERLRVRRGRQHLYDRLDCSRSALVVIDMQNAFLRAGAPSETPAARAIVPQINRLARAVRAGGGLVAFTLGTFARSGPDAWPHFFEHMVNPAHAEAILTALSPGSSDHGLWPALELAAGDLQLAKKRYSAFFPGACELPRHLHERDIDTVIIAGTLTNVCCEASARDAMMADYKVVMASDANAARSDAEHLGALVSLAQFFADVRSTDEIITMLTSPRAPA